MLKNKNKITYILEDKTQTTNDVHILKPQEV